MTEAVAAVRRRVARSCERAGRDDGEVTIVAAAKGAEPAAIAEVVAAGVRDVGFNRVQEFRDKAPAVAGDVRWHHLGAIQTNKVRYLDEVAWLHGLCRAEEAATLHRRGERIGRSYDVFAEVNVAGEASKRGVAPSDVEALLDAVDAYPLVTVRGIMIVAPITQNPEDVRWVFATARRLRDQMRERRADVRELSMGMTDDFEVAVEEGATVVRIGRAIFSKRG